MAVHQFTRKQFLTTDLASAWDYFSNPGNLDSITPKDLSFQILTPPEEKMYPGMMILYRIHLLGIPTQWCTEITQVMNQSYFVDEQRKGPYRMWHHEHHFEEVEGGVLMTDKLTYDVGKSIVGAIAHQLFVRKKIQSIFDYRESELERIFNASKS